MTLVDRLRPFLRPALLAGGLLFLLASGTAAQSTPTLTGQITDQTGVLGSDQPRVQAALDDLLNRENVELWVVFIPTGNGTTASQLAQQTFDGGGMGGNDLLLLVAVNDHQYGWREKDATGLAGAQIDSLLSSQMESRFKAGDYPGGIVAFAGALSKEIEAAGAAASKPAAGNEGGTTGPTTPADYSAIVTALWTILAIILIGSGVVVVALWFFSWRRGRLSAEERDKHTGELARQANKLLVDTDDAVTEAQQELGFAEAEFDEADTKPFRDAIATAQSELKKAFAVRQQLDDATPEDQPTKEKMYGEIIAGCQAASAVIDEQAGRLQALRDLEKTAPQALAALPKAIEALQARLPAIRAAMKTLSGYAPSAWAAVKGNAEEADKRGHFAEQQIGKGKAAVTATPPDSHTAAHAARAAQEAVAQANQLLDAVEQMAAALEEARGKLDGEIAEAEADLAAAKSAAQGPGATAGAGASAGAGGLAKAETLLKAAKSQAAATTPDTIAALKAAQDAHANADAALAGIREASSQQARIKAAFDAARASADTSVAQARAYIGTRRSGVGSEARTKLAEAERHLSLADSLAVTDLSTATTEARVATNMATAAYNLARGDFVDFERGGTPRGGGGYSGGGGGSNVAGAILGGIIGGILSGGRGGGGFGGTRWGSGGGWTGGGGGSGGSGGGGNFGGFGGSHGGGGSWSGGGGGGGSHGGGGGW